MLEALQHSWLARAIGESQMLTASLSAVHLIGFTTVTGSAVLSNLRLAGLALHELPASEVTRPATRALAVGLLLSAVTGFLLFAPRATGAAVNSTFRLKLSLLLAAAVTHFVLHQRMAARESVSRGRARMVGALGLALWLGVAVAACAFILLE
ncbi:MAG TPA: DUF6644 family protein [Vicinamibacterales bacterium]|nr:DUF6644 family protein [Vicinamibacterales bacterium]